MAALLEQWGCTVVTATDEQSALTALDGVAPDAILAEASQITADLVQVEPRVLARAKPGG